MHNTKEKLIEIAGNVLNYLPWGEITQHTAEDIAGRIIESELFENIEQFEWIPVTERLPESGVHILAAVRMDGLFCNGHYVCDAFYAAKYTQSISGYSDECSCVYCEEDDEYYLEEGWYEVIKNWDDYNSIVISDTVTHWMPLPQPPKGE